MIFSATSRARAVLFLCVAFATIYSSVNYAETEIILKNTFIEKYKNRATITATYTVDAAHKRPNPASEVGLPIAAEIMNAASEKPAVDKVHEVEGTGAVPQNHRGLAAVDRARG